MKRIVLLLLVLLVGGLIAIGVRHERKKKAREKRESTYQSALRSYAQVLKPGMTRREVEDYFRANKVQFRQTCCVNMQEYKKRLPDDLVQVGQEDAPWFCNFTAVYIGFQFTGQRQPGEMLLPRPDDLDYLKAVALYRTYDKCL